MKRKNRKGQLVTTVHLLSFLFCTVTWAEEAQPLRLTLNEAVRITLEQHPRLDRSRHRVLVAQAQTEQATARLLPEVLSVLNSTSGAARSNTSFRSGGSIENPNSNQATAGLELTQLIYDFGRNSFRIEGKTFNAKARELDLQADRALMVFQVEGAYFDALKQTQLLVIAGQTIRERSLIMNLAEALYIREKRSKLDVSLAEVEVKNAELLRLQIQNDYKVALQSLRYAMGYEGTGDFHLEEPDWPDTFPSPLEDLMAKGIRRRPDLEALRIQLKSSHAAVTSAKRQHFPSLNAIVSTGETAFSDQKGKWWYGAFGTFSFPLYTGGRITGEIREAQALHGENQAQLRELRQAIVMQVAAAYYTTETMRQKVHLVKDQIAIARIALDLARERLRLGLGSILEVTQAEVAFTRAEISLAIAQYDTLIARAALAYAMGSTFDRYGH